MMMHLQELKKLMHMHNSGRHINNNGHNITHNKVAMQKTSIRLSPCIPFIVKHYQSRIN